MNELEKNISAYNFNMGLLIDTLPTMVYAKNGSNKIIKVNSLFKEFLNIPHLSLEGEEQFHFLETALCKKFNTDDLEALNNPSSNFKKTYFIKINGENKWLEVKRITLQNSQKMKILVSVLYDVTYRKHNHQKIRKSINLLKESHKNFEQFAYIVSHDLQEPLNIILGFNELIKEELPNKNCTLITEYLNYIDISTYKLKKLLNAILRYSRLGQNYNFQYTNPSVLFTEVIQELPENLSQNIQLKKDNFPDEVFVNPNEIKIVLEHLIQNAFKFNTSVQPSLIISFSEESDSYIFSFTDNGIGIEKEYTSNVFKIFQKLHNGKDFEGIGMGLTYCKKIIDTHNGKIWINPNHSQGSTFNFSLPKM